MWKYQKEGLPPRMYRLVRANILEAAAQAGVISHNARLRNQVQKLSKARLATRFNVALSENQKPRELFMFSGLLSLQFP
jgi:hypothetical protein